VVDPSIGAITSWSISPTLPAGLTFTSGHIGGTPTADSAPTAYTITATSAGVQYTFVMTLSVHSGTVLDLGHATEIVVLKFDGTHVFSLDTEGHWVLWNYSTGARIAGGDAPCVAFCDNFSADLAGTSIAIQNQSGIEILSSTDGHVVSTIAGPASGRSAAASYSISAGTYTVSGTTFMATNTLPSGEAALTFIDVSGATPVKTDQPLPIGGGTGDPNPVAYAAVSPTQWLTGTYYGVLFDGASPVPFQVRT
jgi:hypothetical protein